MNFTHTMELIHFRILRALKKQGTLVAAANELHLTQSALSHQIKALEQRLGLALWHRQGRKLVLTQAGQYLSQIADSVMPTIESAEQHIRLLSKGKIGKFSIGIDCHACYEWLRTVLHPFLTAWPELDIDVTSRFRFNAFEAIREYKLDAVLTSDPANDDSLCYEPMFDFELLLIVPKTHVFYAQQYVEAEQLRQETILTYPVPRPRLDIFSKVLQPQGIEPLHHKQVEETDIMLQLVAAHRGVCLLPDWLLKEKMRNQHLAGVRIKEFHLIKTMYLAIRHQDKDLEYISWFVNRARNSLK